MADPWSVQPHEHIKFAEHFRNLGPVGGLLTGEQAKRFMLQSQLPPPVLGQIWFLSDTNQDGKLDLREFSIACKIINLKLHGHEIPKTLPPSLLASLSPTGGVPRPAQSIAPPKPPIPPMPSVPPMSQSILPGAPNAPVMSQPILSGLPSVPPMSQPILPSVPPMSQPILGGVPNVPAMSQSILGGVPNVPTMSQPILGGVPNVPLMSQPILGGVQNVPPMSQPIMTQPMMSRPIVAAESLLGDFDQPLMMPTQPVVPDLIKPAAEMPGSVQVLPTVAHPALASPPRAAAGPLLAQGPASPPRPDPLGQLGQVSQVVTSTPIVTQKSEEKVSAVTSPQLDSPLGMVSPPALEWGIPQPQKLKYTQLFNATDRAKSGAVSGAQARSIMLQSRLPQAALAQIWALADLDNDGKLGCEEFVLAMYLCEKATQGDAVPVKLPPELVPPTFRRESVSSNHSASSYEERRRENMARGQQELERRRSALQDAMMKEKAERERKERDEQEKREKIRVDALKREQEEFARKQKEEQEKREAARKEMERQCQLEWEKKRTRELEALRSEEQSKVLKLKAKSQAVTAELSTVSTRAGNLAKEIRETRTAVAASKCTIDGMRSDRDASMSEMQLLKARVKELNAKQIALNKEKAELDAKAKASEGAGDDGKLSMMEVTLKQLRDKVDAARAIVETKSADLDTNKSQLSELTAKVTELGDKCERVWQMYEERRQEYLERKSTAPAEAAWGAAEADWGTSNEVWGDTGATEEAWNDADASTVSEAVVPPAATAAVAGAGVGVGAGRWRCVYEFTARNGDELSLQPGDWVSEAPAPRGSAEPGWCWGRARGRQGWFPSSYVEEPAAEADSVTVAHDVLENKMPLEGIAEVPEAEVANDLGGAMPPVEGGDFYIASYPYASPEPGDLNFEAGERIEVTRRDGDWWTGRVGNRSGIFPSNYVSKDPCAPAAQASEAVAPAPAPEAQAAPAPEPPVPMETASEPAEAAVAQQEQKSSTPISSEVAAITDAAAGGGSARPASAARRDSGRDSGRDSVTGGRRKPEVAQAIASYTATSSEQLSLTKGQLLVVRKKADSGWWEGELQAKGRNRQLGWFPATYVKLLQPSGRTSGRTTPVFSKSDPMPTETVIDKVVALYPYTAVNADELSFDKDDIIAVTDRSQDPAWWQGELRGMTGLFPSNYVSKLVN